MNSTEFTFQWFEFPRISGSNTFTLTIRGVNERRMFAVLVIDGKGGIVFFL